MRHLVVLWLAGLLAACAAPVAQNTDSLNAALRTGLVRAAQQGDAGRATRDGVQALLARDSVVAGKAFSRALRLDPANAQLHLLAALAYHLGYSRGIHLNHDLAETGYLVSLRMDPNNSLAAELLGQLYLEGGRYDDARHWIGKSILLGESSARAYHAFAVASYYAQDLPTAFWAISQAERSDANSGPVLRAGALIRAASGQFDAADAMRRRYESIETDASARRTLEQRITQWTGALREAPAPADGASMPAVVLAQANVSPAPATVAVRSGPLSPNWSECGQTASSGGSYGAPANADESGPLAALPSPCAERGLPRMTVIDVAIIRSEDSKSTAKGINLLDSLSLTFGSDMITSTRTRSRGSFAAGGDNGRILEQKFTAKLANTASALTYSLNIANAGDQASEVIARPSLIALDRQPSTFFSGSTLTVAQAGQYGAARIDHPVGVSLAVTPTFIDNDSMLLAVRVSRSIFHDAGAVQNLVSTVQASRSSASANVLIRFDQTLALSGLSEREVSESESGVPLLKEIPLAQYLFKTESTTNVNRSILVLITPRRPEEPGSDLVARPGADRTSSETQELRSRAGKWLVATHNLDVVLANLDRKNLDSVGLFRQFRSGDMKAQVWHRPESFERILTEIMSFLYY